MLVMSVWRMSSSEILFSESKLISFDDDEMLWWWELLCLTHRCPLSVWSLLLIESKFFSLGMYEIERKNLILEIPIIAQNLWKRVWCISALMIQINVTSAFIAPASVSSLNWIWKQAPALT